MCVGFGLAEPSAAIFGIGNSSQEQRLRAPNRMCQRSRQGATWQRLDGGHRVLGVGEQLGLAG